MKRVSIAIVRNHAYAPVSTDAPVRPRAACADEDSELFFPIGNTGLALLQIEEAKAVCRRCPLMESCLEGALERNELGVGGGTDEADRRRIKRRAARSRAAA
ncbi:WhiB family transcriptional regulator [Streptomyces lunaelactis]|uniref:WhiB family transcriptional regulator n=1 Tax=Streptomyces lunaelactis TaxID=1535768 RepID=UPI001584A96B|nr:WhiB family transcriptional regulator [Streptomyces lunaelactis]NUK23717.1 WhiB family transcriptional regulator [Streptomyces lunaelactis]